jgi:hypothetical protein
MWKSKWEQDDDVEFVVDADIPDIQQNQEQKQSLPNALPATRLIAVSLLGALVVLACAYGWWFGRFNIASAQATRNVTSTLPQQATRNVTSTLPEQATQYLTSTLPQQATQYVTSTSPSNSISQLGNVFWMYMVNTLRFMRFYKVNVFPYVWYVCASTIKVWWGCLKAMSDMGLSARNVISYTWYACVFAIKSWWLCLKAMANMELSAVSITPYLWLACVFARQVWRFRRGPAKPKPNVWLSVFNFISNVWYACVLAIKVFCSKTMPYIWLIVWYACFSSVKVWRDHSKTKPNIRLSAVDFIPNARCACVFAVKVCCSKAIPNMGLLAWCVCLFALKVWRGRSKAKPKIRLSVVKVYPYMWYACVFAVTVCCSKAMPKAWLYV